MKVRVLITGGSGLLALNWAQTIRDKCAVTLAMHKRHVSLSSVDSQQCSLDSVDAIAAFLKANKPEVVVHTAGLTSVEECEAKPDLAQHVNVKLAENIAKACFQQKIRLVHISTDHLFSGDKESVTEEEAVAPLNVYAQTKAEAEARVLGSNPDSLVIRTNFYGWGTSYRQSFSDYIINNITEGNTITLYRDVFYSPIFTSVLAQTVHDMIVLNVSGIYHVVGDERISKYEFGLKVAGIFQLDPGLIKPGLMAEQNSMVRRPYDMSLSNKKVSKLLTRKLGGVDDHLALLEKQQDMGLAKEIQSL